MDSNTNTNDDHEINIKDNVEMYRDFCSVVHTDNLLFLEKYKSKIKWQQTGDRTIDLGCGEGTMTKTLEKYLPPNYECLVGCDLNQNMVKFANENYASERIKFHVQDIEGEMPDAWKQNFDHVFSFYVLHYVKNHEKAFRNIFDLLVPGGDCFLLFMARHPMYDLFLALSKMEKWSPYLQNVDNFLSPYYDCQEPDEKIADMMDEIGFSSIEVRSKQMISVQSSLDLWKNIAFNLSPLYREKELKEEFLADVDDIFRRLGLMHPTEDGGEVAKCAYNIMLVYATK